MDETTKQTSPSSPRFATAFKTTAPQGEWDTPAIPHVSLGLSLSNHRSKWQGRSGLLSADIRPNDVSICEHDRSRTYILNHSADFGVIILADEVMLAVSGETRYPAPEIHPHPFLQDTTLTNLSSILMTESNTNYENGQLFTDSIATALAQYLWHNYSAFPSLRKHSTGGLAPTLLRRSIDYIQANLGSDIRLRDLAKETGFSPSHFLRSFRQSTGMSPHQYLLHRRVERVQRQIRNGAASLAEVALACGFADQHHMARVFRRITGISPTLFRRSL